MADRGIRYTKKDRREISLCSMALYHMMVASTEGPNARNRMVIHAVGEKATVTSSNRGVRMRRKSVPGIVLMVNRGMGSIPSFKHDFAIMLDMA